MVYFCFKITKAVYDFIMVLVYNWGHFVPQDKVCKRGMADKNNFMKPRAKQSLEKTNLLSCVKSRILFVSLLQPKQYCNDCDQSVSYIVSCLCIGSRVFSMLRRIYISASITLSVTQHLDCVKLVFWCWL